MKLLVHVVEARCLTAMDLNGLSDPYVRLQLGKQRGKTKVVKKNLNPSWDQEFSFRVGDLRQELIVSVLDDDGHVLGQVKVPLSKVLDADSLSLGTAWYQLHPKNKKSKIRDCGEICLTISLSHKNSSEETPTTSSDDPASNSDKSSELMREPPSLSSHGKLESAALPEVAEAEHAKDENPIAPSFFDRFFQVFSRKNVEVASTPSRDLDSTEILQEKVVEPENCEKQLDEACSNITFDELLKIMESNDQGKEIPANLPGGVLIDQSYVVSPGDLNSLLFSPSSTFPQTMADLQRTTGLQAEPWRLVNDGENLKRTTTYIQAATRLVKSVKATEEQTYLKADGKAYAVLASVSIPDVPFGSCFKTEVLYCILPGPELPSEEQTSRLLVSWRMNFVQSTMMKGMILSGARQGLKDSFNQFANMISQNFKRVDLKDSGSKEQILSSMQTDRESDWKLAIRFLANFTAISSVIGIVYVLTHIMFANPSTVQGLEFVGLDLPDSIGEVVVCGVLVLQAERFLKMIGRFFQARKKRGTDHGVKAQGDGWLLTIALIEGSNLAPVDSSGHSDPYVVFTCNGKTKTSSIKFQILDPQWNEIFEFDAMNDPPSVMDVDVYDFDGPFDEALSLGHAEINFVKSNLSDLADIWIPLEGKLAQACQSKLHLRVFLNNTRGSAVVKDYLTKMEKEVGKKINERSPQTNSTFQKLFGLSEEEFLINDFTCHLKRKLPLQGRLFLSSRIIGFYTNLFGHKTKFYFLWEDIEEIQVLLPTLSSMGSPILMIMLRKGRGMDAKHGAKAQDEDGRLKFHFQTFVSFSVANRTIMALWKARSLTPEQKVQIAEEEAEERNLRSEEGESFLGVEDAKLSEIFSTTVDVCIHSLMDVFGGGPLERRVMEKVGCAEYSTTPWELVKGDALQRQVTYKFDKNSSPSEGEVTSTQQKSPLPDRIGWAIEEVVALQGILLGDHFKVHMRYQIEDLPSRKSACSVQVSLWIDWLKSTKHQKRVAKSVIANASSRLKGMFRQVEKELTVGK